MVAFFESEVTPTSKVAKSTANKGTMSTLFHPKRQTRPWADSQTQEIFEKTIRFFEAKGKQKLKRDYHAATWYSDFLQFVKEEKIFYRLLTPPQYSKEDTRWDTRRNADYSEILGFYGLNYWYTWQVTILGLGPIWMSANEEVKYRTAQFLKEGGIFAFGLSEKDHGADLYASEMFVKPQPGGGYLANGRKYYIGNANAASLISTFGRIEGKKENPYVFFVVQPKHEKFELVKNVVHSQNFVAEYALHDYPLSESDILARDQSGWDTALNTVNVGKFNLGWASIGICTHAFYEAIHHAGHRRLFDKKVTDFVHVRRLLVDAYVRLVAMKAFSLRAVDYFRAASPDDRRYLLYNPLVKMKVTTQGEEVVNLLSDVIAAKGFEKDMYFEMATKDIRALPKLEGTVHVNMALIVKFMANYFFKPEDFPPVEPKESAANDDFLFNQGTTKGLGKLRFHDFRKAYSRNRNPNSKVFYSQIRWLRSMLLIARPNREQAEDFDFLLNLGELFSLAAYGQLILEYSQTRNDLDGVLLEQIFDVLVRDFSKFALQLSLKTRTSKLQVVYLRRMIKRPTFNAQNYDEMFNRVIALRDAYEMRG